MPSIPSSWLLPQRTLSGRGTAIGILAETRPHGLRGICVHGRSLRVSGCLDIIQSAAPKDVEVFYIEHEGGEPTLQQVDMLRGVATSHRAQWVVAVGGGSVMDLAKAAAGLAGSAADTCAYHGGRPIDYRGLPLIVAPTTAGTGSEATPNSVLTDTATCLKKSIRHDRFMASTVILDPDLLAHCPSHVIAYSGMDALTQAMEAFISRHACWFSDSLALRAIGQIHASLEAVYHTPSCAAAEPLLEGSYLTGIALASARLGVVHGIAHPLGSLYKVSHGLICAICLPLALELNRATVASKYAELSTALGSDAIACVSGLITRLGITSPFRGQPVRHRARIVNETLASGSTATNPKPIIQEDVEWLLDRLFAP